MRALAPSSLEELGETADVFSPTFSPLSEHENPRICSISLPAPSLAPAARCPVSRLQRVCTVTPSTCSSAIQLVHFIRHVSYPLVAAMEKEKGNDLLAPSLLLASTDRPTRTVGGQPASGHEQREGQGLSPSALLKQPLSERRTSHAQRD